MTENTLDKQYIELANAPAVEGIAFRRIMQEADYPAMVALINASNEVDQIDERDTLEDFTHQYNNLKNCDPQKDIVIVEVDGKLVGYARVWWMDIQDEGRAFFTYGRVHPDHRRQGIGGALLNHNMARIAEIIADQNFEGTAFYDSWYTDTEEGTKAMLKGAGFEPERYFFEMSRDLSQPIEDCPMPEGLEIRPSTPEQFRQIWDGLEEAFRDHWGHPEGLGDEDFERWANRPTRNPDLWKVGWEGDEVAGMVLNEVYPEENKALGHEWGWTDPICVRRPWRKRGLAKALITESMRMFKEMGMTHAMLGVDTQNPLGAFSLYEGLGYERIKEFVAVRKPITE